MTESKNLKTPNIHDLKALKDLIMCSGMKTIENNLVKCTQRKTCVRCIKLPEADQQFFSKVPFVVTKDGTDCEYYFEFNGE